MSRSRGLGRKAMTITQGRNHGGLKEGGSNTSDQTVDVL